MRKPAKEPVQSVEKKKPEQPLLDYEEVVSALQEKAQQSAKLSSSKMGLPEGWRKATVIIRDEHYEKLKDISYWERIPIKDIIDQVLERFLSSKRTKPIPKEKQNLLSE